MKFIVFDGRVVGYAQLSAAEHEKNYQSEYKQVEGPDAVVEDVYFDGESILRKPEQSSDNAYWDIGINEWVVPPVFVDYSLRWASLSRELVSTSAWEKVYAAGMKTIAANFASTLLIRVLDIVQDENALLDAFNRLREVLVAASSLSDFTQEELDEINSKLEENNFTIRV